MTQTNDPNIDRIQELEARLVQQDHSILELSDEVYQQQQQLGRLELKLEELGDRLRAMAAGEPTSDESDETPPHY